MAGVSSIDKLPEIERLKVVKALTEAGENPDYRGIIRSLKLKCSHMSLWRYHRYKVKPTIERNQRAILSAMDDTNVYRDGRVIEPSLDQQIEARSQVESVTRAALADDPIIQAAIAKRRRLEGAILETLESKQFDTYAKLECVDIKAIELQARASMHPGFTAATAPSGSTNIVLVLPGAAPAAQAGEVIDVDVVE